MEIVNTAISQINAEISFIIVLITLALGYVVRDLPFLKKWHKIYKIAIVTLPVTLLYMHLQDDINFGMWVASYAAAFGFHALLIKWIENKITPANNEPRR